MTVAAEKENSFHTKTRKDWRRWLEKNHNKKDSVWLIIYRKASQTKSVYYSEAVEEALCFGWIDSKPNKRDKESFYLYFAKRKLNAAWSKINRVRVERLTEQGLIKPAGQAMIDIAKQNGKWSALDKIDNEVIPTDLEKAFKANKLPLKNFNAFPPSSRKIILLWIQTARKTETRVKRIKEAVQLAEKNIRANHYRQ